MFKILPNKGELVPISQAAQTLGISIDTLRRWDKEGKIASIRPNGKDRYFKVTDLKKIVSTRPLSISEAAKTLGVSQSTLRRIENKGVVTSERDPKSNERNYNRESLEKAADSDYFKKNEGLPEETLESENTAPKDSRWGHLEWLGNSLAEVRKKETKTLRSVKALKLIFFGSIIASLMIFFVLSLEFLLWPKQFTEFFGLTSRAGDPQKVAVLGVNTQKGSLEAILASSLKSPAVLTIKTLRSIGNVKAQEVVIPLEEVEKVASHLRENTEGDLSLTGEIVIPASSQLILGSADLVPNLNAQFLQGRQPGTEDGDIAIIGEGGTITIADDLVTTEQIVDLTIQAIDITDGAVTSAKLAPGVGGTPGDNTVTSVKIVDGTITSSDIGDSAVGTSELSGTLTFENGDLIDLSAITHSTTSKHGLILPNASSATPSNPTSGEGYLAWDSSGDQLIAYNGSSWSTVTGAGGGVTSLNSLTGALTIAGGGINTVGASGSTITITATEADTLSSVTGRGSSTSTALTLSSATPLTFSGTNPTITYSGGDTIFDLTGAATRVLNILNSTPAQVATLNLSDGEIQTNGTSRLTNAGILQNITGLTVSSGTVTFPAGQIDNTELANSSVTVTAGTGLSGGGAVSLGGSISLNSTLGTSISSSEIDDDTITLSNIADSLTLDGANLTFASSDSTNDYKIVFDNSSTGAIATLLQVTTSGSGSSIATALDLSDTDIDTALTLGGNDITVGGVTISSSEFALIDSGVTLGELTDNGTLTATTVDINGGTIDGVTIGATSAGAATFTTLTTTGDVTLNDSGADSILIGQSGTTDDVVTIAGNISLTDDQWSISATGVASGVTGITADSVVFANVGAGTNTNALVIGSGGSLSVSGTGTITATDLSCTNCIGATEIDESTIASTGLSDTADIAYLNQSETVVNDWTFGLAEAEDLAINLSISGSQAGQGQIITLTNSSSSGNQYGLYLDNAASSGLTDSLLVIDNSDTNTAVTNAIEFIDGGGTFTNLFNVAGTAITISEFTLIDSGIALSELTDSGTLTATTVDLNGGAIDGITIGSTSAGAGTFSTLTATGEVTMNDSGADNILIGQSGSTDDTVTIAGNISLTDDQWSITSAGVGNFVIGTVLGSMTFTTNNIVDSGALTIKTTTTGALTLDTGTTGTVNLGTGSSGKAINIGTDDTNKDTINIGSALDDVAITGDQWSITNAGVLTVQSCSGCAAGGSQTPWTGDIDADNFSLLDFGPNLTSRAATTIGSANNGSGASGLVTLTTGTGTTSTGGLTLVTGNASAGTAGNVVIDVGTSTSSNGLILIGTAARAQTVTIGNSTGGTITVGATSGSDLVLNDAQWSVTGAGAGTFTAATVTTSALAVNSDSITSDGATLTINAGGAVDVQDGLTSDTFTVDAGNLTVSAGTVDAAQTLSSTAADNTLQISLTNNTSSGTQNVGYLDNVGGSGDTEALLVLDNSDADNVVGAAIKIVDAGGTFTNIIDNAGILLSGSEINLLNEGVALSELTDSGTLTATIVDINGGAIDGTTIGASSASTGAFTTISTSGQITSTLATGTAPLVIASTTNVANLNASSLNGATFAAPGAIGGGTAAAGTFTTLTTTGTVDLSSDAGADTITIGQSGATDDTVTIAGDISLADDQWGVTAAGVGSFVSGTVLGSQTFTTNNILDSGALTIKTTTTGALTLDTGTTGIVNLGTGTSGKTINIGTDNTTADTIIIGSALDTIKLGKFTTENQIIYTADGSTDGTLAGITNGVTGQCLTATTGLAPAWGSCGGGGAALDTLTVATTDDTALDSNNFSIGWNWDFAAAAIDTGLTISESSASTTGTQDQQALFEIITLATSTASPLQVTAGGTDVGDVWFDLTGASDFEIRDSGAAVFTVTDAGAITATTTTTAALTLDTGSTGAINVGTNANAKAITIGNNTGATAVNIDVGTGDFDIDAVGAGSDVLIDAAGAISLDATGASSNFTVTGSGFNLTLAAAGGGAQEVIILSAGTGASAINVDATGTGGGMTFDTTDGAIALTAAGAANGDITLAATDDININGTAGSLVNIGTSAVTQTITVGALTNTDLVLQDANWNITGAGALTVVSCSGCTGGVTLDTAYTAGNTITTDSGSNVIITLQNVATPTSFVIENQDTAGVSAQYIFNSIAGATILTNGLLVEQTGSGTMTNAIQVLGTAGAITSGLLIADGAGTITNGIQLTGTFTTTLLDTPSLDISAAGAITGATGVSTTTLTATGDVTMNDAGADNILIGAAADTVTIISDTLSLTDNNWSITAAGVGNFVSGTVIGSQTFTTNNILDSGALTIKTTTTGALTLDSGTTGIVNLGTGNNAKTIAIGTGNAGTIINIGTNDTVSDTITIGSALDDVAITGDQWNITDAGVLTVASCTGCGGGVPTTITVANEATDTTSFIGFFTAATGDLGSKTNAGLTFNASTSVLTATGFAGPLTGNVTGNTSGTAATVTGAAQTAITSLGTLTGLTVSNTEGTTVSTITTGDAIISDGSFAVTDDDNAQSFGVINNTANTIGVAAAGGLSTLSSTSLTTGDLLELQLTEGTLTTGNYLTAWDVTVGASVFEIGEDGIITAGTSNIQLTDATGHVQHDSIVDCGDQQILKWSTGGGEWGCAADAGGAFDSTTVDATTWSDNANASNIWTFDVSGTDHTMTAGNGLMTFGDAVTVTDILTANGGIAIGANTLTGSTAVIDFTDFDVGADGNTIIAPEAGDALTTTLVAEGRGIVVDATTANTTTTGIIDLNVNSLTSDNVGLNIDYTINDTATADVDLFGQKINVTANDADADAIGLKITTTATTNAIADTYFAGLFIDNADTTANSLTDAIRITSSGVNAGITDAIDVSDGNITNALNVGANDIVGTTGIINYTGFDVDASGNLDTLGTITAGSANTAVTLATGKIDADALTLTAAADGGAGTSSGSGLEARSDGIGLLQGCTDNQILKWDEATDVWACDADNITTGTTVSFITGTATYTPTAGTIFWEVWVTGQGGGGGGADNADTAATAAAGGGGAGGTAYITYNTTTMGANAAYVVGTAAGAGGANTGGNGTAGTDSTFNPAGSGATITGAGGALGTGRTNTTPAITETAAGLGGTATNGAVNLIGGGGTLGFTGSTATTGPAQGGIGGASYYGGGGKQVAAAGAGCTAGIAGGAYGSGGGGAICINTTAGALGGNGAVGIIMIKEYLPVAGADLAEVYYTKDTEIKAGDVVSLDSSISEGVKKSTKAYDGEIFGIIATKPGLLLGEIKTNDEDTVAVMVSLAGRVPVQVNTENGPILHGDLLTSSSVPGVAMKATKAGQIVGQAMSEFNGDPSTLQQVQGRTEQSRSATGSGQVGKIMAFIKTDYSNGAKLADILPGLATEADSPMQSLTNTYADADLGKQALTYFLSQKDQLLETGNLSEIIADRIVAGVEIITPKLIADEIEVRKIRADQIEGLTFLADQIISEKFIQAQNVLGAQTATGSAEIVPTETNLTIDSLLTNKGLTVLGPAEFREEVLFAGLVNFEITPIFNKDTAGFAFIKQGAREVEIKFEKEYSQTPIVTANPIWDADAAALDVMRQLGTYVLPKQDFIITNINTKGFIIILEEPAAIDLKFSWMGLAVKDARTFESLPAQASNQPQVTSEPTATPISEPSSTPEPSLEPSAEPTVEPSPSPAPASLTVLVNELGYVRIRVGPSADTSELGKVLVGETITYYEENSGWYRVDYDSVSGWVSGAYIQVN